MAGRLQSALQNFTLPVDVKDDIVSCQRTMRNFLKVHQLIVDNFNLESDDPKHRDICLRQIENELHKVNCEQEFATLRLRRIVDEFLNSLKTRNIQISRNLVNKHVSELIVPLVKNVQYKCVHATVNIRFTEEEVMEKYLYIHNSTDANSSNESSQLMAIASTPAIASPPGPGHTSAGGAAFVPNSSPPITRLPEQASSERRISLLKPISERVVNTVPIVIPDDDSDVQLISPEQQSKKTLSGGSSNLYRHSTAKTAEPSSMPSMSRRLSGHLPAILRRSPPRAVHPSTVHAPIPNATLTQPSSVTNNKRQNLRNALRNAAANMKNQSTPPAAVQSNSTSHFVPNLVPHRSAKPSPQQSAQQIQSHQAIAQVIAPTVASKTASVAPKVSKNESTKKTNSKANKSDPSSSEDSLETREPSPERETKTKPEDCTQLEFLRQFMLITPDQLLLLQQRRSKRQRRCVHNERADFHYGKFDDVLSPDSAPAKKRKREFLSPRSNRTNRKPTKRLSDRSTSSSPDERSICKECSKRTGAIIPCNSCQGAYHEKCHKDANIKHVPNQCPPCARAQNQELPQNDAITTDTAPDLRDQFQELQEQMAIEQRRRERLQRENADFKVNMTTLYGIVKEIKRDQE